MLTSRKNWHQLTPCTSRSRKDETKRRDEKTRGYWHQLTPCASRTRGRGDQSNETMRGGGGRNNERLSVPAYAVYQPDERRRGEEADDKRDDKGLSAPAYAVCQPDKETRRPDERMRGYRYQLTPCTRRAREQGQEYWHQLTPCATGAAKRRSN